MAGAGEASVPACSAPGAGTISSPLEGLGSPVLPPVVPGLLEVVPVLLPVPALPPVVPVLPPEAAGEGEGEGVAAAPD